MTTISTLYAPLIPAAKERMVLGTNPLTGKPTLQMVGRFYSRDPLTNDPQMQVTSLANLTAPIVSNFWLDLSYNHTLPYPQWQVQQHFNKTRAASITAANVQSANIPCLDTPEVLGQAVEIYKPTTNLKVVTDKDWIGSNLDMYLSTSTHGLVKYDSTTDSCSLPGYEPGVINIHTSTFNRTGAAIAANPANGLVYVFGGVTPTVSVNGTVTSFNAEQDLYILDSKTNTYIGYYNLTSNPDLPPTVFQPIIFASPPNTTEATSSTMDPEAMYMVGGWTSTTILNSPTVPEGSTATAEEIGANDNMMMLYKFSGGGRVKSTSVNVTGQAPLSITEIPIEIWGAQSPNRVRNTCATYMPGMGLVSDGFLLNMTSIEWVNPLSSRDSDSSGDASPLGKWMERDCKYFNGTVLFAAGLDVGSRGMTLNGPHLSVYSLNVNPSNLYWSLQKVFLEQDRSTLYPKIVNTTGRNIGIAVGVVVCLIGCWYWMVKYRKQKKHALEERMELEAMEWKDMADLEKQADIDANGEKISRKDVKDPALHKQVVESSAAILKTENPEQNVYIANNGKDKTGQQQGHQLAAPRQKEAAPPLIVTLHESPAAEQHNLLATNEEDIADFEVKGWSETDDLQQKAE